MEKDDRPSRTAVGDVILLCVGGSVKNGNLYPKHRPRCRDMTDNGPDKDESNSMCITKHDYTVNGTEVKTIKIIWQITFSHRSQLDVS
jgi:hypothetical protein